MIRASNVIKYGNRRTTVNIYSGGRVIYVMFFQKGKLHPVLMFLIFVSGAGSFVLECRPYENNKLSALASLNSAKGVTNYRESGALNWEPTLENQVLFSNDRISTAKNSTVEVNFRTGEKILLEEKTQIELSQMEAGSVPIVTLIKGYATGKGSSGSGMVLKTIGGQDYLLTEDGDQVCLSVEAGGSPNLECYTKANQVQKKKQEFISSSDGGQRSVKKPIKNSRDKAPVTIQASTASSETEKPVSAPIGDYSSRLIGMPRSGAVAWTSRSLRSNSLSWKVTAVPPVKKPKGSWSPIVEILSASGTSRKMFVNGSRKLSNQTFNISLSKIRAAGTTRTVGIVPELSFQLRGGGRLTPPGGATATRFSAAKFLYKLRSIADISSSNIRIGLSNLRKGAAKGQWFYQTSALTNAQSRIKVTLRSKNDVRKMMPFLYSGSFSIDRGIVGAGTTVFIARNMEIIASISGDTSRAVVSELRRTLQADFVFRGSRAAFFDSRNKSPADFQRWLNNLLASGGRLYVMRGNKLFPISKNFVKTKSQVLKFIGRNASYIFARKVEILDARSNL